MYQRLTSLGWSHPTVSSLWGALAVGCTAVALGWDRMTDSSRAGLLAGIVLVHVAIAIAISTAERRRGISD